MTVGSSFLHLNCIIRISPSKKWIRESEHHDYDNSYNVIGREARQIAATTILLSKLFTAGCMNENKNEELFVT